MVDSKVIDAFHMMWGSFPEPVRLIHKDRKVLAVNEIAASRGMEVGVSCFSVGNPEFHKVCCANEALASKKGQSGAYSRRINIQHRLVYQVLDDIKTVKIIRTWAHYE